MPVNLIDAAAEWLRQSACAAAFGDTWDPETGSGTMKFFADWAAPGAAEPYAVVQEIGESYEFMTARVGGERSYIATGRLQVAIYAPGRQQARDLGVSLCLALNDAPLSWPGDRLMYLRMAQASFVPMPQVGPGTPSQFVRLLIFDYQLSSSLQGNPRP